MLEKTHRACVRTECFVLRCVELSACFASHMMGPTQNRLLNLIIAPHVSYISYICCTSRAWSEYVWMACPLQHERSLDWYIRFHIYTWWWWWWCGAGHGDNDARGLGAHISARVICAATRMVAASVYIDGVGFVMDGQLIVVWRDMLKEGTATRVWGNCLAVQRCE